MPSLSKHDLIFSAVSDPFFLPFSIFGAGDQPFPYTSIAGSPPPSIPNTFGSSAPWTYYHRGGEWKAGQGAQRGGQADKSISFFHHLYMVQLGCRKHFTLSVFACLTLGVPESWQTAGSVDPALSIPGCSNQDTLYHSITGTSNIQWPLINICENIPVLSSWLIFNHSLWGWWLFISLTISWWFTRMTILYWILLTGITTTCPWRPWPVWEPPRCPSEVAFSKRAAEIVTLFSFYTFLLISLLSQLCGRSGPSMEGPIIWKAAMACLSRIYYCWFQGNGGPTWTSRNGRKWEGRGGGFWTTECVFPMAVLAALYCHCFYRGKWCSGQCSLFPTGEPRLDRKWRRSVIGGQSFVSAHLIISAVLILKCPINTNQITMNSK